MTDTYEGGCLCGAVRFRATGAPKWVLRCHCQSCRRHSGAPMSVFVAFMDEAVEVTRGEIARFESSPGVRRGFCATCGSTLTCSNAGWPGENHYHVGAFDEPERLPPSGDIYGEERVSWLRLAAEP
jgi:hypothetical protein